MKKTLEVWKTLWPHGVPVEDYETALHVSALAGTVNEKQVPQGNVRMRTPEAAEYLGVPSGAVSAWARRGQLTGRKGKAKSGPAASWTFSRADLDAFAAEHGLRGVSR
jgi:hypothetical protein